jgi:hypothetical protein
MHQVQLMHVEDTERASWFKKYNQDAGRSKMCYGGYSNNKSTYYIYLAIFSSESYQQTQTTA